MSENPARLRYTDPAIVLSPKGSVANLSVLRNTGEDGFAVASLMWDDRPALGMRWNGHPKNPIGNPQSRGIPTWFIVPDELAPAVRAALGVAETSALDLNTDITRVRIRPLPHRIKQGVPEEPEDYVWVLSITDRAQGRMEIMNPATGHFMAIEGAQVVSLLRDTAQHEPSGPKHGILTLNVQMVFEDGRLTLEPPQTLMDRIELLSSDLRKSGYAGNADRVLGLIKEARISLARRDHGLGRWETVCLDEAQEAVAASFLQLALTCTAKAIAVSQLPHADYEHGFNYGRREDSGAASR